MDSWTLQGDSYSFLRSAPRNFSLCHRDGTPNHVEIFDIINTPTQRSAISETTCLCDIFGDDAEAASLSSSPPSTTFTQPQTDVEGRTVASPSVDDLNDSSGSYHTAHSSSEGEEGLEDSSEKQSCSQLQSLGQDSDLTGTTSTTRNSPDLRTVSDGLLLENRTPDTLSQGEACESLSSSLADIRSSSSNSGKLFCKTESRTGTPFSEDRHSSVSHHTSTPELRYSVSPSSSPSLPTKTDFREISPKPGRICDLTKTPSPELQSPSKFLPKVIISSTNIQPSPCTQQGGRISVPDLFSRDSTPDLDDHPQTPEPISNLINDQEDVNLSDTDLPQETTNSVSTPDLKYTSPSPTSSVPSLESGRQSFSSEIRLNTPSPNRLSPSSLDRRAASSQSIPNTPLLSSAPESRTSLHSPVLNHSLSPSPRTSPVVYIDKAATPEIRITSPAEPKLHLQENAASPQITKISYCIVQPEVQISPAFSQEPCLVASPKSRDCSPILDSPHNSPVSPASVQLSEYKHTTPIQDSRNQSPLFEHCQSLSPQLSSRNRSPVSPLLDQPSSEIPSAENTADFTHTNISDRTNLSSIDTVKLEGSSKPESPYKLQSEDSEVVVTEITRISPVAPSNLPFSVAVNATESTNTKRETQSSHVLDFALYPEKQPTDPNNTEGKASHELINCPLPDPLLSVSDKNKNILFVHKETHDPQVKVVENPQTPFTNFSQSPKSNRTFNPNLTPKPYRRQLSGTVTPENNNNLKENMASYVKKRRTPSPPLTRFTPVHIIAPEKPYRQWQNRGRSPPQMKTSLPSANLKKVVTNTEIPQLDPVNNSQEDWFRKGQQQEMERGLQLQESATDQELQDCGMYRQRKKEERIPEKREGWHGDACYREEQVELSFNAKNRKGPVSRNTGVTSRDTRPGLPTAHSFSESLLTRQSKQQQTLQRLSSHPDSKSGGLGRRLQPPINQHKSTASGRVATNRPGRSSSSSMGSELDEADHEVKWFTDVAFSSLSSPEVDYLDMYNSSHHSSTNVSQLSTQESPAGVNTPLLSYADFSGSTQMMDNDDLALQQASAYYSDGLDPSRCCELGSFECVDVAVEKEDTRKVRRGVPKRQIQLKRRDTTESKQDESSENSSPGVAVMDNFCQDPQFKQHYSPASFQESEPFGESPEVDRDQNVVRCKLQKSSSFDESTSKTKIATCLIKSVLTKKMQSDELAGEEEPCGLNENISTTKNDFSKSSRPDVSDDVEANEKEEVGRKKNLGGRPSSTNSNRSVTFSFVDSEEVEAETRSAVLSPEVPETSCDEVLHNIDKWKGEEPDDSANTAVVNTGPGPGVSSIGHVTMTNRQQECENMQYQKQTQQDVPSSYMPKSPNSLSLSSVEKKKASLNVCLTPETENKYFLSGEKVEACADGKEEEEMDDKMKAPIHKVRDVRRLVKNTYNLSFKPTSAISSDETDDFSNKEEIPTENRGEVTQESKRSKEVRHSETQDLNEEANNTHEINKKDLPQQKDLTAYSQPIQIEYKAVCWKEDKNKIAADLKNKIEQKQPVIDTTTQNVDEPRGDSTVIDVQGKGKVSDFTEKQQTSSHWRTDKPMLGSLPKMPSKEREVSTAIVLIRDNSRAKKSVSPFHEEFPSTVPASSPGVTGTPSSSGRSVSMLLKEKGYQADIGAVVGEAQNTSSSKSAPSKHVNCLEIPLQTTTESHRERTFSSSSTPGSTATSSNTDTKMVTENKIVEAETVTGKPDSTNKVHHLPPKPSVEPPPTSKQAAQEDFETVKRLDPTFPPRSPAVRRFKPQPIEVKSTSKDINKQDTSPSTIGNSRPQAIEVKSVAKNSQKPIVPPKPSCKFKPLDLGTTQSEPQRQPPTSSKSHNEDRTQTIVVSSPTIYRKIPNDSTSNYTRKVAVSSVSSLKPPPSKPPPSNVSTQASPSEPDTITDRHQRQSSRYTQRHPTLPPAPTTSSGPTFPSSGLSDATGHQPQTHAPTGAIQTSQTAVPDSSPLPHIHMPYPNEPATVGPSDEQPAPISTTQASRFNRQSYHRSLSNECSQRRDDLHFYASDDPPSYDERESFSPLRLPDLPPRSNRYQPSSRPPPCSCTSGCPSHPGLPQPHNSPHNLTPPAPTHSPGHPGQYPVSQPPLRPHHCRSDPQSVTYQSSSPKASSLGQGPQQGLYQPLHPPPACPPHPSLMHSYSGERPLQPAQHMDPRRPPVHRSPQQPPAVMAGAPYPDPGHSHSPGLPHIEPHYMCGPQSLGPSYGSDYGGDSSSIYSESSYTQTPRRVLMDPETGKYFYIEVPVQPLRKMLFDPETGQYVEVLIPQQAMSHSGLYPPSAPNYPPIHSTNMYAPAPQYMPFAAPPSQPQPPRYSEPSAATSMHPHAQGVSYRNPSGQGSKAESQSHPPVDPNYLESMYYVPTGMNASPNTTPPDYYHKHQANLPPSGGKRS